MNPKMCSSAKIEGKIDMNTKTKLQDWTLHGSRHNDGSLPERGFHNIVGPYDDMNMAVAAHLAVSVSAGDVGCGLSAPDKDGVRHALGGFFGKLTGAPGGVAIITNRPDAMARAIEAAALARGAAEALPIAIAALRAGMARSPTVGELRLPALRDAMGDNIALVILDGLSSSTRARYETVQSLASIEDYLACAVFVIAADLIGIPSPHDSSTLEVGNGVVSFHPAEGEGWERAFTLDRIRLLDGEAVAVRPGEAVAFTPKSTKALIKAVKVVVPLPEPKIEQHVVLALGGYNLHPGEAKRWPAGSIFVRQTRDAVAAASAVEGLTEITIVRDHADKAVLHIEEARLRTAIGRNLEKRIIVKVSDKTLIDPYSDAA
jgi:hypothetical protein